MFHTFKRGKNDIEITNLFAKYFQNVFKNNLETKFK